VAAGIGVGEGRRVGTTLAVGDAAGRVAAVPAVGDATGRAEVEGVNAGKIGASEARDGCAVTGSGVQIAAGGTASRNTHDPTKANPVTRRIARRSRYRDLNAHILPEQASV
jgi:hypothetical protein